MSEEAKEATPGKKKKGKLPVIVMLLALIGGGGFFGMKMKGGGPKKVVIKAAAETVPFDKEFLVNLSGSTSTYLRVEISLELREDFKKEGLDPSMPAIKDDVIKILRSRSLADVSADKTDDLQHTIAVAINRILISHMKPEERLAQDAFEKEAAAEETAAKSGANPKPDAESTGTDDEKEVFNCPSGPVLNVYFTSFTTQ